MISYKKAKVQKVLQTASVIPWMYSIYYLPPPPLIFIGSRYINFPNCSNQISTSFSWMLRPLRKHKFHVIIYLTVNIIIFPDQSINSTVRAHYYYHSIPYYIACIRSIRRCSVNITKLDLFI